MLAKFDSQKAAGGNNISPHVLKSCATSLTDPLCELFSLCLSSKSFTSDWKIHKVRLIPSKTDLSGTKMICLSSPLCHIQNIQVFSLSENNQSSNSQFGFLNKRSCLSQMLVFFSEIYEAINSKSTSEVIHLDFFKAFDFVPEEELIFKLRKTQV